MFIRSIGTTRGRAGRHFLTRNQTRKAWKRISSKITELWNGPEFYYCSAHFLRWITVTTLRHSGINSTVARSDGAYEQGGKSLWAWLILKWRFMKTYYSRCCGKGRRLSYQLFSEEFFRNSSEKKSDNIQYSGKDLETIFRNWQHALWDPRRRINTSPTGWSRFRMVFVNFSSIYGHGWMSG